MTALPFPSGERVDVSSMPAASSGRTTLADGREGAQLQPRLRLAPLPGLSKLTGPRLRQLADELGTLVALEQETTATWLKWAEQVERQALAELARREAI